MQVHFTEGNQAQVREGAVTPSLHPEVLDTRFASPGRGLGIRQSMGWTKVCEAAQSRFWVVKGNARARMLPDNLDHRRVEWTQGSYETAWVTPGHNCLCPYKYGHGAAVRPQTNDAIWDGVIGLWSRVAPLLSPWCARGNVPTGVNLNRYSSSGSCIPWHSDNESLFGSPNQPNRIFSVSLGHAVVFQVRRVPGDVPSSITWSSRCVVARRVKFPLRFGWTMVTSCLWMVWPHRSMNIARRLGFRVLGLTLPTAGLHNMLRPVHLQRLVEPSSRWLGEGENKWSSSLGLVLLLLILVTALLVSTWIHIRRRHRHSGQRPSCSAAYFPSRGRARWVGRRRWRLSRRRQSPKKVSLYFPFVFLERKLFFFLRVWFSCVCVLLSMLVAKREPTPCYRGAYSVDTVGGHYGRNNCKTTFSPLVGRFFLVSKRSAFF